MNRINPKATVIMVIISFTLCLSFMVQKPVGKKESLIQKYSRQFEAAVKALNQEATRFRSGISSLENLKQAYIHVRKSYKQIELFVEYAYPGFIEEHINGAPLLHIQRHDTRPFVVPPEGLQVIDELIFAAGSSLDTSEIALVCQQLENQTILLVQGMDQLTLSDQQAIEAMRQQIIRIFTLGTSGFDTPGSLHALEDARVSFATLDEFMFAFKGDIPEGRRQKIHELINDAQSLLAPPITFEDFDRFFFLKSCINPLYKELHDLGEDLNLDRDEKYSALDPGGINLFSDQFLDPYVFTRLKKEEDNTSLRELGKKLFYDPLLSYDGKMSCASCHNPARAFSDGTIKSASAVSGVSVQRNSPTLLNAVYADRYFYDLRAFTLEQQAEHVIFNTLEFNTAYEAIVAKLNASREYRNSFKEAVGSSKVSRESFSKALASYVLSLRSFNSPFDKYVRGERDSPDQKVIKGFNLFMGKAACGTCHFPPTFSGLVPPRYIKNESEILGVLNDPHAWKKDLDTDMGRFANEIYSEQAWIFERSFKTTTVRNVELTAPYFHNGAYPTLEAVVNFYNSGGGSGFGIEVKNQTLAPEPLNLDPEEKDALIAFMKALTDNPFSQP